ncbi:FAD-dependent monooxygenase [Streptomyces olivoreticuli]
MTDFQDVVVVGAGPAGLALAVALRLYGVGVTVVEKECRPGREPRVGVLRQRALEVMRDLGCAEGLLADGLLLSRAEVYVRGRHIGRRPTDVPGTAFPRPLSVEQGAVRPLLERRLRALGGDVRRGTEALAVRLRGDGAEVDVRGPDGRARTLGCRWVVGCDGARGLVGTTLGIPCEGEPRPGLQALQINAEVDWKYGDDRDTVRVFLERRLCAVATPRPGGGYRLLCFLRDPDPRITAAPCSDDMRDLLARGTHDPGLHLMPTEPPWAGRARFHDRAAASLRVGRALLVGDSAHAWAPVGGHGLDAGLRGAHNLGWKLAAVHHGWAAPALLDTYATEQRRTALQLTRWLSRTLPELPAAPPVLAALGIVGPAVRADGRMDRRGRAVLSHFAADHRTSALSADGGGPGPLRAGDRLPDLPVVQGGRRRGLHDLLSYARWTLLVVPGHQGSDVGDAMGMRRVLADYAVPAEVFHVRPVPDERGRPGGMLLVRPDGHVGLRARPGDGRALAAYLGRWFVRQARPV